MAYDKLIRITISETRKATLLNLLRLLVEGDNNTQEFLSLAGQYTEIDIPSYEAIIELYKGVIDRRPICEIEGVGFEHTPEIKCPCGCPEGVLRVEGANIDNTRTFLPCNSCGCCYHADNIEPSKTVALENKDPNQFLAPWTDEQVIALNRYQHSGLWHPFTGKRNPDDSECILIATNQGWVEQKGGPVIQRWAWKFMAETSSSTPNKDQQ